MPVWNRLGVRLGVLVALGTLATVGILTAFVLRVVQTRMEAQVIQNAALLSDTIKGSTYLDMLHDRRADVYAIMETIGRQEGIERVRVFNKEGRITFSTADAESGTFVDKRAESCFACHVADRPISRPNLPSRARTYLREGHRTLGMVTPIYNEPSCSAAACHVHPASQSVIGVVDVGISLQPIDQQLARLRWLLLGLATAAAGLLVGFMTWVTRKQVVRPIEQLVQATRRLATGDLAYQVSANTTHEIGDLERSLNDMALSLGRMRAERLDLLGSLERQVQDRTAALRAAQEDLIRSEKLSSLGRLSASVAHEINNPLAGILTTTRLLIRILEEESPGDPARSSSLKQLRLVQRETERCTAIVRSLLDFARERPLTLADVDSVASLEEAVSLVASQARLQNVQVEREFDAVPPVHADHGQLRQAFVNVVINACDAMSGGGRLTLRARTDDGHVVLEVADTGEGIPEEHRSRILDPFFTTKERGTGLGLSVVYGIVERHGGTLEIDSTMGVGTTVRIRLPIARPDAVPVAASAPGWTDEARRPALAGQRVGAVAQPRRPVADS